MNEEDKGKDKELLAGFHHTISEQLNSRLSESPKFFGLLIVVSTAYGYVLSKSDLRCNRELFVLASVLSYSAVLWAAWYLAALGYAFRFLQNSQHLIEHALDWSPGFVPGKEKERTTGEPPNPIKNPLDIFWLLPGIYHAHVAGLVVFLTTICGAFWLYARKWWPYCRVTIIGSIAVFLGLCFICWINWHYFRKFRGRRRSPPDGGPKK